MLSTWVVRRITRLQVRFSHGGNMFAAVNSNTIQVFKTYSCEVVCNLRGHNNKARLLSSSKRVHPGLESQQPESRRGIA